MTKEELKEIRHLDYRIKSKRTQIEDLRDKAQCLKGINYTSDKVQVSSENRIEEIIAKICDMENSLAKEIDVLLDLKAKAKNEIDSITDKKLRDVLEMRYLEMRNWEYIAVQMNYNYRWILRLHGKALKKIGH